MLLLTATDCDGARQSVSTNPFRAFGKMNLQHFGICLTWQAVVVLCELCTIDWSGGAILKQVDECDASARASCNYKRIGAWAEVLTIAVWMVTSGRALYIANTLQQDKCSSNGIPVEKLRSWCMGNLFESSLFLSVSIARGFAPCFLDDVSLYTIGEVLWHCTAFN